MTDAPIPLATVPMDAAHQVARSHGGLPIALDVAPWRPGRFEVADPTRRRPVIVAVAVDGEAHCRCGTTPVGEAPACRHIAAVRAWHADPLAYALRHILDTWLTDECWRGDDARQAHWARRAMRLARDAEAADASTRLAAGEHRRLLNLTREEWAAEVDAAVARMNECGRTLVRDYADDAAIRRADAAHAAHEDSGGWARVLADSHRAAHDAALLRGDTTISEETP